MSHHIRIILFPLLLSLFLASTLGKGEKIEEVLVSTCPLFLYFISLLFLIFLPSFSVVWFSLRFRVLHSTWRLFSGTSLTRGLHVYMYIIRNTGTLRLRTIVPAVFEHSVSVFELLMTSRPQGQLSFFSGKKCLAVPWFGSKETSGADKYLRNMYIANKIHLCIRCFANSTEKRNENRSLNRKTLIFTPRQMSGTEIALHSAGGLSH
jgi:hypothetical protein